ncbi:RNA polymerase sigma factor [Candidatus Jorgensenbacteria bacterium]|nr:RNA polymerase sigma factor [Candidatus Jorgensenbacteria bacterium]
MDNPFERQTLNRMAIRMRKGDERAARVIYDTLVQKVFGFCMNRVRERRTAEDITQEIFLKLVNKIDVFDEKRGSFLSWFWQLARNTVIDYIRSMKNASYSFSDLPEGNIPEEIAEEQDESFLDIKEELRIVREFVSSLGSEEQEIFELKFVSDLPYRDISTITGKNEGALRVTVNRLRSKIKQHIKK